MKHSVYILLFLCCYLNSCGVKNKTSEPTEIKEKVNLLSELQNPDLKPFYYGVASGDPLQDAVIIWTKIEPKNELAEEKVTWQMSKDSLFNSIDKSGIAKTDASKGYTIKVDVTNLSAGTYYYYRFIRENDTSLVGRTRTAPKNAQQLKFAVASCANYVWGYFNAYGRMAEEDDLNAIIFLGDYIYEYGARKPEHIIDNRNHIPINEIVTLEDYRTRYAQYHLDDDLMQAHLKHPFIPVWDDHEVANNAYMSGAQNHSDDEGSYETRKAAAMQAYYEWLPIRESENHYRSFNFGNLADLMMLDERLAGRTKQLGYNDPEKNSESHSILGEKQFSWFEEELEQSKAKWKLIGNQVILSYQYYDNPNRRFNVDTWNGYPKDQSRMVNDLKKTENAIVLTGDTHSAWAFEVTDDPFKNYNAETGKGAVAVEIAVASVNTANHNELFSDSLVTAHEKNMLNPKSNPHLKYLNRRDHGYVLLTLTEKQALAEYKVVPTNKKRMSGVAVDTSFVIQSGTTKIGNK
ncbi:alkaline phosphatase D family protein [Winogradskyella forsetii]|uniref:alkaline phosphatase D family protein n=1 Tax=Winogradskyella forsetii TaxID=2686077 RepID=UPI0015BD7C27|nr:alkaline phosphatase D family protein [Winogradskyella forsetii]